MLQKNTQVLSRIRSTTQSFIFKTGICHKFCYDYLVKNNSDRTTEEAVYFAHLKNEFVIERTFLSWKTRAKQGQKDVKIVIFKLPLTIHCQNLRFHVKTSTLRRNYSVQKRTCFWQKPVILERSSNHTFFHFHNKSSIKEVTLKRRVFLWHLNIKKGLIWFLKKFLVIKNPL